MIGDEANTLINRAKKWQVISGGPLNKRLYHDDDTNPQEHVRVTLSCSTDNTINDAPGKIAHYWFNGMMDDDIMFKYDESGRMDPDEPLWPYQNACTGQLLKPNLDTYDGAGAVATSGRPAFASGQLSNPSDRLARPGSGLCDHHGAYEHNSEATFSDDAPHWVSCDADERLLIKVFD